MSKIATYLKLCASLALEDSEETGGEYDIIIDELDELWYELTDEEQAEVNDIARQQNAASAIHVETTSRPD